MEACSVKGRGGNPASVRVRAEGAGRKTSVQKYPGIKDALLLLLDGNIVGNPEKRQERDNENVLIHLLSRLDSSRVLSSPPTCPSHGSQTPPLSDPQDPIITSCRHDFLLGSFLTLNIHSISGLCPISAGPDGA